MGTTNKDNNGLAVGRPERRRRRGAGEGGCALGGGALLGVPPGARALIARRTIQLYYAATMLIPIRDWMDALSRRASITDEI